MRIHHEGLSSRWPVFGKSPSRPVWDKLKFPPAGDPDLPALLCAEGFDVQPISWPVIRRASQFPWHHPDPFDRYIAAEALTRDAPVLSIDAKRDYFGIDQIVE